MTWNHITWHCDSCFLIATFALITIKRIIKILHVYGTMANTCLSEYGAGSQRYTQHALWMGCFFVLQPQTPCKYWHNHCWVKYAHFEECITYPSHYSLDVCPLRAAKTPYCQSSGGKENRKYAHLRSWDHGQSWIYLDSGQKRHPRVHLGFWEMLIIIFHHCLTFHGQLIN